MAGKTCSICGKPSGIYPLCKECFKLRDEGKIVKCPDCETWHYTNAPCECETQKYIMLPMDGFENCVLCKKKTKGYAFCKSCYNKYDEDELLDILNSTIQHSPIIESFTPEIKTEKKIIFPKETQEIQGFDNSQNDENNVVVINEENKSRCITCGKKTNGLLFCPTCYQRYKDKALLFKITECSNVELLDDTYEGRYTCKDGHIVKSKSEREIDNYLFEHGISHAYEKALPYGATDKEVLHPDFYLPNYLGEGKHVYIEHWGYNENNIQYTKTKKFKMPIYEKLGITLICTHEKTDTADIDTTLDRKLNKEFIKEGAINFDIATKKREETIPF